MLVHAEVAFPDVRLASDADLGGDLSAVRRLADLARAMDPSSPLSSPQDRAPPCTVLQPDGASSCSASSRSASSRSASRPALRWPVLPLAVVALSGPSGAGLGLAPSASRCFGHELRLPSPLPPAPKREVLWRQLVRWRCSAGSSRSSGSIGPIGAAGAAETATAAVEAAAADRQPANGGRGGPSGSPSDGPLDDPLDGPSALALVLASPQFGVSDVVGIARLAALRAASEPSSSSPLLEPEPSASREPGASASEALGGSLGAALEWAAAAALAKLKALHPMSGSPPRPPKSPPATTKEPGGAAGVGPDERPGGGQGWLSVVGLAGAKGALEENLEWPARHPRLLRHFLGSGAGGGSVLLYGPPGTGKTSLARAAAAATGSFLLELRATDVVHSIVGTSERALENAFAAARRAAESPLSSCFIFIDEFQSLFGSRDGDLTAGIASLLLQLMDDSRAAHDGGGGGGASCGRVIVVAATNCPEAIDPSFLRPGRFDRVVYCGPPDADDRRRALANHAACMPWAAGGARPDVEALAAATEGFTVADLAHLSRAALYAALRRAEHAPQPPQPQQPQPPLEQPAHLPVAPASGDAAKNPVAAPAAAPAAGRPALEVRAADYGAALAAVQPSAPPAVRRRYETWAPSGHKPGPLL